MFSFKRRSLPALLIGLGVMTNVFTFLSHKPAVAQYSNQYPLFYDLHGNWANSCIVKLANQGIINGYPDGSFRPMMYINRAEFAAIVGKAFPQIPRTRRGVEFRDVHVYDWAHNHVAQAYQRNFLSGYPGRVFKPNQRITRSQVLVALASGLNYVPSRNVTSTLKTNFADAHKIPQYAQSKIAAATERSIVVNYPDVRLLHPNKQATRAEVAAFLCQALATSNEASVIPQQYIVNYPTSLTAQSR